MRGLMLAAAAAIGMAGQAGAVTLPFDGTYVVHFTSSLLHDVGQHPEAAGVVQASISFSGDTVTFRAEDRQDLTTTRPIGEFSNPDSRFYLGPDGVEYGFSEDGVPNFRYVPIASPDDKTYFFDARSYGPDIRFFDYSSDKTQTVGLSTFLVYFKISDDYYVTTQFELPDGYNDLSYLEYIPASGPVAPSPVPLPAAASMLMTGAASLFALRRKRR